MGAHEHGDVVRCEWRAVKGDLTRSGCAQQPRNLGSGGRSSRIQCVAADQWRAITDARKKPNAKLLARARTILEALARFAAARNVVIVETLEHERARIAIEQRIDRPDQSRRRALVVAERPACADVV